MTKEEIIAKIEEIAPRMKSLSADDKKAIRKMVAATPEISVKLDCKCPNRWADAVLTLRNIYCVANEEAKPKNSNKRWQYLRKQSMVWRGMVIDDATPDTVIDEFVLFHPQFFKLRDEDTDGNK